jgi:hypothetical protein
MLRVAVLVFGLLALALGVYLCRQGPGAGGIPTLFGGGLIVLGTLFERWRYKNRNVSASGDWQATGERFVDPETGREMEVLYDPNTGERRYREMG